MKSWPYNPVDPAIYKDCLDWPKISIVTPSYNQGKYIEETILSVINQGYPNLEYIIIDGGSSDDTIKIIKKYEHKIAYWISEKDSGQADAINKGFEKATGEIFAYLNSDDCYFTNTLFEIAKSYLENSENKLLFIGNCYWGEYYDDNNGWIDKPNFPRSLFDALKKRGLAPQPSMFWTNPLKLKFLKELRFCMDFEFWLKLINEDYKVIKIEKTLSLFRMHPNSKTSTLTQILQEELNGVSALYKKYLSPKENREITNFLLKQNQLELYEKLVLSRRHETKNIFSPLSEVLKSSLPLKMKLSAFFKIIND
ncbi:glycosyltransferase family 2 protein [Pedobacter helvus]|uniref:Glycosyltransferase family 2 protein n=1 Tax=Pedobacter helvus TaxID=2563444 RepID=A0ABW9JLC0_9SPHI|nr:glycosyltransferase family 2 protein [Pedobacter ureilyticus]